jgi:hypothetical protein
MDAHPISLRIPPWLRAQLERAAAKDDRPLSALVRKILADWVKQHGAPRDR